MLHNDPQDFRYFLWFLHAEYAAHSAYSGCFDLNNNSIISMEQYNASASRQTRFQRALGIATVAHMYSATRVLKWAVTEFLKYLTHYRDNCELMSRAYRLASRIADNPTLLDTVRREWVNGLRNSEPVDMLAAAKSVGDHGLLGCAYFAIIQKKTAGWIATEPSLTPLDRTRLMVGALNLRRWESRSYAHSYGIQSQSTSVDAASWSPRIDQNVEVTDWDSQQLWDLFSRSSFGIKFDGDTDMSEHDTRPESTPRANMKQKPKPRRR